MFTCCTRELPPLKIRTRWGLLGLLICTALQKLAFWNEFVIGFPLWKLFIIVPHFTVIVQSAFAWEASFRGFPDYQEHKGIVAITILITIIGTIIELHYLNYQWKNPVFLMNIPLGVAVLDNWIFWRLTKSNFYKFFDIPSSDTLYPTEIIIKK